MSSLNQIIDHLKADLTAKAPHHTQLNQTKKVVKGPAVNPNQFPIITIIPIDEALVGLYGSQLRTNKRIRIEVIEYGLDQKKVLESGSNKVRALRDFFSVDSIYHVIDDIGDSILTSNLSSLVISDKPTPWREGFLHISSFEVTYLVKEDPFKKVNSTYSHSNYVETDNIDLIGVIEATYRSILEYNQFMRGLKSLKALTLGSHISYPVLYINLEDEQITRAMVGKVLNQRSFSVNYICKELDVEEALTLNIDNMDKAKYVMFANPNWGKRAITTEFTEIVYGKTIIDGDLLFGSSLRFLTSSLEKI